MLKDSRTQLRCAHSVWIGMTAVRQAAMLLAGKTVEHSMQEQRNLTDGYYCASDIILKDTL